MGKIKHETIEQKRYSTSRKFLQNADVYSEKYRLYGKIDLYNQNSHELVERKYHIKKIYDGYRSQVYAHYFCLQEMGYEVKKIFLHSLKDNKRYVITIPKKDEIEEFESLLERIWQYRLEHRFQQNPKKCRQCIYNTLCDIH